MCKKNKNRKVKILDKFLHYTVIVKLNDFETYTGVLVPDCSNLKEAEKNTFHRYFIIYEENDSERVKFFYAHQLLEMWTFYKGQVRKVFSVIKDD